MIDIAFAKKFVTKNGDHIPYTEQTNLTGTLRFSSINAHKGIE